MENIPAFYFQNSELQSLANRLRDQFLQEKPFPHVVIDNFVPEPILARSAVPLFPGLDCGFGRFRGRVERARTVV